MDVMRYNRQLVFLLLILLLYPFATVHGQLSVAHPEIHLGTLSEDDSARTCLFVCKNSGSAPVVITRVKTTCGCTDAEVDRPQLQPGEEAHIKVVYHPLGHPGRILTYISVFTGESDEQPATTLTLTGTVTPSAALWKEYRYAMGNLRLRRKKIIFSAVKPGQQRKERIVCANAGSIPLILSAHKATLPEWLTFRTLPAAIPAGEEGVIEVTVDGSKVPPHTEALQTGILLEGLHIQPTERTIEVVIK